MSDAWFTLTANEAGLENASLRLISQSAEQTQEYARQLGALLTGGELLLLDGNLGAGKTTFTQGLARGMQITSTVSSPTFTLLKEYWTPAQAGLGLALYHFDLYRLDEPEEILDLGFEEYFYGTGVSVVEWADKAAELWPPERLVIRLQTQLEDQRSLAFYAAGAHYCQLLRQFQKNTYATARS
ncbi:tRNA (adenosine(37)-N6)-threonylcarbamoyltransferase complex ATPase subunit type 1 TsaE [Tengunoibacter tsumagoiensis]|uniref:tRNA threonylcarbamoyladenosine biosynthesis protein TsaE n=1 Tax=Tengunoibacter tsumagoiensis TaxID=2014871 RepID=A0A402A212_9CHLR|nr:tRNA (adenosine(37)-N6)-threonylcarbamoyltransferase complex ATPase subunit type 1 TsaE [Tengunoibacter tsumagoiensis]GCE13164.1 tRNA (adenosine(37)-N6)-threonylcarbamoyltransferase complex ATPase subunit type 1 TsaE [Tengunoibacter tsumagoiensis]